MSTILIKNGTLIDGSGSKRYLADILIENEKIKKILKFLLTKFKKDVNIVDVNETRTLATE